MANVVFSSAGTGVPPGDFAFALANIRVLEERARLKLVMKAGRAYTNTL